MLSKQNFKRNLLRSTSTAIAAAGLLYTPMANAIVPNDNFTPADIIDDSGVNGVGMFFRNDGFVCTGTLINPRTVLFAAHCVNSNPESDFGEGGLRSAFSFDDNALPGFINWINNGFASNPDLNVYDVSQIWWNPESTADPNAFGFLEADIALASLSDPAGDIPTWALLFSALPNPGELSPQTGTGYHVNITGYGRSGSGTTGASQGIDWRRRAAENFIGALTSFDQRNTFLFGQPFGDLPQDLYRLDFDDPNQQNPFDANLYMDEPLENEGTTAGGDSGGPLILDAENNTFTDEDLVIGVLSGGSRFFGPQVFSSYGTESFFQPLYAFYEYIAATNPYRYVSAQAGDGNWEDNTHWVTDLDPMYRIIDENGNIVNGMPTTPQTGTEGTDNDFGAVCFDLQGDVPGDECMDLATGEVFPGPRGTEEGVGNDGNAPTGGVGEANNIGVAELGLESFLGRDVTLPGTDANFSFSAGNSVEGAAVQEEPGMPVATIENGRPGATGFVPDNLDPAPGVNGTRRFFDVTLSADGTTTLSSDVTIDRLTINGAGAGLNVASTGSLMSLIDIEQIAGTVNVDGTLSSAGDYLMMAGLLTGTGTVETPFYTNVLGAISPGTEMGEIGTLTIDGSAILASASGLFIDIAGDQESDLLAITGDSSLGGQVYFMPTADTVDGNSYTFLTTGGAQSGEFTTQAISPILNVILSYTENSAIATIEAGSYSDVIDSGNAVQSSYAELLDKARAAGGLGSTFAVLDLSTAGSIQSILDSWAPVTETTARNLGKTATDHIARLHRSRMDSMSSSSWGGKMTVMGNPVQLASNAQYATAISDVAVLQAANGDVIKTSTNVPYDMEVFVSGAFIDGEGSPMPTAQNFGPENFDGFSVSGGIEKRVSDNFTMGSSLTYTELEAEASLLQGVDTTHFGASLYGQVQSSNKLVLDGQLRIGTLNTKTNRTVSFPQVTQLQSDSNDMTYGLDIRVSRPVVMGKTSVVPRASLQTNLIKYDTVTETGGVPALEIDRDQHLSTQGRLGFAFKNADTSDYELSAHADFVKEFGDIDDDFNARFAGVSTLPSNFALYGTDKSWGEVGLGLAFNVNDIKINFSADTTVGRSDLEAQTYRAGISHKF